MVENSDLRNHSDVQLYHEGVAALVGYVIDGKDGKPAVIGDDYPVPGSSQQTAFVVGKDATKALVALQMPGKQIGLSLGRTYAEDGSGKRTYTPLKFRDRVAVVKLPAGQKDDDLLGRRPQGRTTLLPVRRRWVESGALERASGTGRKARRGQGGGGRQDGRRPVAMNP